MARTVFIVTLLLVTAGIIMIYSTSAIYAWEQYSDQYYFVKRQLLWAGLGFIAMLAASVIKLEFLAVNARYIFGFTLLLLVLVLIPPLGIRVGGARRWLNIGLVTFQPTELAKMGLIIYSAVLLSGKKKPGASPVRAGPVLAAGALAAGLIMLQPDFGSAVLAGGIVFLMMFVAGADIRFLLGISAAAVPVLAALVMAAPYRLRRIFIFLDPWDDPGGSGYQMIQSFLALGSGGFLGRGLGRSVQKLYYLPESFTDFIFSIIGEETGFLGALAVLSLFGVLVFSGFKIAAAAEYRFARFAGFGVVFMIALQCVIHIGVVTGCLPPKGLPLPFISFGGSSLIVHMFGAGILMNISRKYSGRGRW